MSASAQTPPVHDCTCPGYKGPLRLRVHYPPPRRALPPVLLYFHGGRFVSGNDEADALARQIADRFDAVVVAPAYSLASDSPFPAAIEDGYAALKWVEANAAVGGWSADRVAVIGEEAGGNIAAAVAMMARDRGGPQLSAQVLISPMLDPTLSTQSMQAAAAAESAECGKAYQTYLPLFADRTHPYAAPLLCSRLSNLPPALIFSAEGDPLRDEAESYGARLIAAGVKTQVVRLAQRGCCEQLWRDTIAFVAPLLNPMRQSSAPTRAN
jgi:acetyl esterase/lipase